MIKHYNYLSDKYPSIFDKKLTSFLIEKYYHLSNNEITDNNQSLIIIRSMLEINLNQIHIFLDRTLKEYNSTYKEIYNHILSFAFILKNPNENKNEGDIDYMKIFLITKDVLSILGMINFKINLEDNNDNIHIFIVFNNYICEYLLVLLNNILNKEQIISTNNSKFGILNTHNILKELNLQDKDNIESVLDRLYNEYSEYMTDKLLKIIISHPKNNFYYEHSREHKNFPFFLMINLKINNISYKDSSDVYLVKNLLVNIQKNNEKKSVDFTPSNIKYNSQTK